MNPQIWYTARQIFDPDYGVDFSWGGYIKWSKLTHLSELVSLDGLLNGLAFEPDFNSAEEWKYFVIEGQKITRFFNSFDYVMEKTTHLQYFNLLAVVKEPNETKSELSSDFDFVGYDLIETDGEISALTNCGGFDKSFLPNDLNEYGLVSEWARAKKIQTDLKLNYPKEQHANCQLFEVWRHKRIGRKNKKSI
jgi:hypothetical protein